MPTTEIEWCDRAWPIINGCRRVSPGCENCWAERLTATRLRHHPRYKGLAVYTDHGPRWTGERRLAADILDEPLRVRRPQRWFVANKGDLFGEGVTDEEIALAYAVMAMAPQHTFQVLTKRAERLPQWYGAHARLAVDNALAALAESGRLGERWKRGPLPKVPAWPPPNVWIGVSVEDQQRADERIPHLLRVPAAVRFLSVEPLLGPVDLRPWIGPHCRCFVDQPCDEYSDTGRCSRTPSRIGWAITGYESGPGARLPPNGEDDVRALRDQCVAAGVPFFYKQLVDRARKVSLPFLDGRQWAEFPR